MTELLWVSKLEVLSIHAEQIARHGGPLGLRDEALLESALARPQNLLAYETPDLAQLAAAYAWGLVRNHAFVDGNKRTSCVVCLTFLRVNGLDVTAGDEEVIAIWQALAEGSSFNEAALIDWLHANTSTLLQSRPGD